MDLGRSCFLINSTFSVWTLEVFIDVRVQYMEVRTIFTCTVLVGMCEILGFILGFYPMFSTVFKFH